MNELKKLIIGVLSIIFILPALGPIFVLAILLGLVCLEYSWTFVFDLLKTLFLKL